MKIVVEITFAVLLLRVRKAGAAKMAKVRPASGEEAQAWLPLEPPSRHSSSWAVPDGLQTAETLPSLLR